MIYCVVRAPSQEAVYRHYAERGLPCDDVHQIAELGGVTYAIAELWPGDLYESMKNRGKCVV